MNAFELIVLLDPTTTNLDLLGDLRTGTVFEYETAKSFRKLKFTTLRKLKFTREKYK